MITYTDEQDRITVKLDGKVVGWIEPTTGGYCYHVKGASKRNAYGETFPTTAEVKRDIEGQ